MSTNLYDCLGFACFDNTENSNVAAHPREFLGELVVQVHKNARAWRQVLYERCRRLTANEGAQGIGVETIVRRAEEDDLWDQRVKWKFPPVRAFPNVH